MGVLCFCTVGGTSDFLKLALRLRNSVHTRRAGLSLIGLGGGRVGSSSQPYEACQGDTATGCGILDASVGDCLAERLPRPSARLFYLELSL